MNIREALQTQDIEHVSASQINQYHRCPRQWAYRNVLKMKSPPDTGLLGGSAVHYAAEVGMRDKVETGRDPHPMDAAGAAESYVKDVWAGGEVVVKDGESLDATLWKVTNTAEAWAKEAAPPVEPVEVEQEFRIEVAGVDVVGRMDVVTKRDVVDWKTSGKSPSRGEVAKSLQVELYSLATGLPVTFVYLVNTKTRGVNVVPVDIGPAESRHAAGMAERTVSDAARGMALGVWPRNRAGWHCSRKWCGYYDRCMSGKDDKVMDERAREAVAVAVR